MHSRAIEIERGRRPVIVRPLAAGDTTTVAAVLRRSSTAATEIDVAALATVDASRHALVAYAAGDPQPAAIGQLARVSRTGGEVSLVVADRYVGTGLDNALVELLAADAGAAGLSVLYLPAVPYYICPRCKERSVDIDAREGFSKQAPACRHCGFGFLFELLDDYYPAPDTGMVVTDQERRVLAIGRGVFELTGFPEADLLGRDIVEALQFSDDKPVELAREWGVRRLNEQLSIRTRGGSEKRIVADVFPAYDDDGGLLLALTPRRGP